MPQFVLRMILLGVDTGLPKDLQEAFKDTGTTHIIAISGFNITIIAGIFVVFFGKLFGDKIGALVALFAISIYTILVGADAAVVRAALPQHPDVVVTDGGAPLRWCFAGRSGELSAFRVPVVDSTGAGDAFTAGLLHGLLHDPLCSQPGQLLRFASACGALVCQGAGAIDPQPSSGTVQAFLAHRV